MLAFITALCSLAIQAQNIGVVQRLENDSLIYANGYRCVVESTQRLLSPAVSEETFNNYLSKIAGMKTKLLATNIFIPGNLKVVGPDVDEKAVLTYVESVFTRAEKAGIGMIVWGSAGSRAIPNGFDRTKAKQQFIEMAKRIADLASKYDIILVLENLNRSEVNFINTLEEALDIAKRVDHPNLKLCADIYHMLRENESPGSIEAAGAYIAYSEVAEKENRTAPGVRGDDFTPYFTALRNIGYNGPFVIECRWSDIETEAGPAYLTVKRQLQSAYSK